MPRLIIGAVALLLVDFGGGWGVKQKDGAEARLHPTAWMNSGLGKIFTAGGALRVPLAVAQERAKWLFDWLSYYNQTLEGALRLSVYKVAIDDGVSKQFGRSKFNSKPRRTEIYAKSYGIFLWFFLIEYLAACRT
jgi:hypothetical protein